MKYKLFIADFDGTLGNVPDYIAPETVEAIKDYQKKGGIFSIITGRSYSSISGICRKYDIPCVVASFQGARITDLSTGKELFSGGIQPEKAVKVIKEILPYGYSVVAWAGDTLYYREDSFYSDLYTKKLEQASFVKSDDITETLISSGKPVGKICIICPEAEKDAFCKLLSKKYKGQYIVNSGASRLIEIIHPDLNKGYAVKKIAEYYGVSLKEVLTVGDSTNDMELIDGEWHGVAVGDAKEELKAVAKEITVDYKDKPVKVLLEKYA